MSIAVLSIGSNIGDRLAYLQGAVDSVRPWLVAVSLVYETSPWGPIEQGDYLNAVMIADDGSAGPGDWLARAQATEDAAGRTRDVRWGPRTLDVDLIAVDDVRRDDAALTLPHPRARERAFVLVPWLAVDPQARLTAPVADLLASLPSADVAAVRLRSDLVLS